MYMFIYSNFVYFFFPIYIQHYQKSSYIKCYKIIRVSYRQLTSYFQLNKPNKNKRFTFMAFTIKKDLFPNDLFTLTDPTLCHISVDRSNTLSYFSQIYIYRKSVA